VTNLDEQQGTQAFLASWLLVTVGGTNLLAGLASGHLRRNLLPDRNELNARSIRDDLARHRPGLGRRVAVAGLLQGAAAHLRVPAAHGRQLHLPGPAPAAVADRAGPRV